MFDEEYAISESRYGKKGVRLLRVDKSGPKHSISELEVQTELTLSSKKDYTDSDNADIIATDSQKNTVYILAKQYGVKPIENFATLLSEHFLTKYPQVNKVHVHIEESPWQRIQQGGQEHNHAFLMNRECYRFCDATQKKHERPDVSAGITGLQVLKTTQSAFFNFVDDEYRSLPDAHDRICSTVVEAKWMYGTNHGFDYDHAWQVVRGGILDCFGGNPVTGVYSSSVQNTLYVACKSALNKVQQIEKIEMAMPNKHYFAVDFSKFPSFGIKENSEVFMPVDKPAGNIMAVVERKSLTSRL